MGHVAVAWWVLVSTAVLAAPEPVLLTSCELSLSSTDNSSEVLRF